MEVSGSDGKSRKNTAALSAELNANFFDPKENKPTDSKVVPEYSSDLANLKAFEEKTEKPTDSSAASLSGSQIDQLQYKLGTKEKEGKNQE